MATVTADMPTAILDATGRTGFLHSFEKHRVNHFVMRHCFLSALLISKIYLLTWGKRVLVCQQYFSHGNDLEFSSMKETFFWYGIFYFMIVLKLSIGTKQYNKLNIQPHLWRVQ